MLIGELPVRCACATRARTRACSRESGKASASSTSASTRSHTRWPKWASKRAIRWAFCFTIEEAGGMVLNNVAAHESNRLCTKITSDYKKRWFV